MTQIRPLPCVLLLVLTSFACGSKTEPTLTTYTISGTLTSTNGGAPLAARLDFSTPTTISIALTRSDAGGRYSVSIPTSLISTNLFTVMITGDGLVDRRAFVMPGNHTDANIDAIVQSGGFDLSFYRQLVRNTFDAPEKMEPLRRWTRAPQIYLRTINDAGVAIDAKQLDSTEQAAREAVSAWTAGAFTASVVRGIDTKIGQPGWITILWPSLIPNDPPRCGKAEVGKEGGFIELDYKAGGSCSCPASGLATRPRTVWHEVGHALGFYHTDSQDDLMSSAGVSGCEGRPSARELYHAAIAYRRQVGNVDPDFDLGTPVNLTTMVVR